MNKGLECGKGFYYNILAPLTALAAIFQLFMAIITNALYFKSIFNKNTDILKKISILPDIVFLLTKTVINIIFATDKNNEKDHFIILFFLILFSGINAYFSIFYQSRLNKKLILLNKSLSIILFFAYLFVLGGKLFYNSGFNGLIFLFFVCFLLIIIYIIFYHDNNYNYILIDYMTINNPEDYLYYIFNIYIIFINKNNSRNNNLIFKNIIQISEGKCLDKDCPLKKYIFYDKKGLDNHYLLIKYCDKLFQYGISKFNYDNNLKANYLAFLIFVINDNKKALLILNSIEGNNISFTNDYNIYLCKKLLEKTNNKINDNKSLSEYKNDLQKFKELIRKTIFLYFQFISLLLECKNKNITNFEKINEIGNQIIELKKQIDDRFKILKRNRTNNTEIITLYSDYIRIVSDKEDKYQIVKYNDIPNNEIDYLNVNIQSFKDKDNMYLIVSGNKNNVGTILDCSTNFSTIVGYQKKEIIDKNINILIPEIFHKKHDLIIMKKFKDDKLGFYEKLNNKRKYNPNYLQKEIYCITKSKFLLPIKIKIYPAKTQENEFIYIAKIIQDITLMNNLINMREENVSKYCVLTDSKLIIKTFTPNCLEHLNLEYKYINSNNCIINNIRECHEEYLIAINKRNINEYNNDNNNGFSEKNHNSKKEILINKIKKNIVNNIKKRQITWKINKNNDSKNTNFEKKDITKSISLRHRGSKTNFLIQYNNNENEKEKEISLIMEIKKIILDKEVLGYYFIFTNIYCSEDNNLDKYQSHISEARNMQSNKNKLNLINSQIIDSKDYKLNFNEIKRSNSINKMKEEYNDSSIIQEKNKKIISNENKYVNILENIVKENYISKPLYLSFSINNFSFELSNDMNNKENFNELLKKEASHKIKLYKEYLDSIQKSKNKSSSISTDSEDENESNSSLNSNSESPSSSNDNNTSKDNNSINVQNNISKSLSFSLPNSYTTIFQKTNKLKSNINQSKTIKVNQIKERKSSIMRNEQNEINKVLKNENPKQLEKKESYSYYKINFNNIRYFLYDFNREIFSEVKKNKMSKIDEIIKNKNIIHIGKDNTYPNFSYQKIKNNKNKDKDKENQQNENIINTSIKDSENKKKSFKSKIDEIISRKEEDSSIKKLKTISIISFFILLICGAINLYFNLLYYNTISILIKLLKHSIIIKYNFTKGVYYTREITLLNFNIPIVVGGAYTNIPSFNKTAYILLMTEKLFEVYLDNEEAIKYILSSSFSFSNNNTEYLSNYTSNLYFRYNSATLFIKEDFYSILTHFNNALYSLASEGVTLTQTHNDIYNYNRNTVHQESVDILINIYISELENLVVEIKINYLIILIIYFIVFIIIYLLLLFSFLSANKKRKNYMDIFYGINENLLKNSLRLFQNLINKLKIFKNPEIDEEEDSTNPLDNISNKIKKINKYNNNTSNINNKNNNLNKNKYFTNDIIYIILFGLFLLIIFLFFIVSCSFIFNISNKALLMSQFFYKLEVFQISFIEIFTSYRQYLFDDTSRSANGMTIIEIIEYSVLKSYNSITSDLDYIEHYINEYVPKNEETLELSTKNLCSYYITDYFNSTEECLKKYGYSLRYDFNIFATCFLQEVRVLKNLLTYLGKEQLIRGNLNTRIVIGNLMSDPLMPIKGRKVNGTIYRLDAFNNDTLHQNLNIQFINIILPYLENYKKTLFKYLLIEGDDVYFIIISSLYLLLLIIIFFIYWLPMINHVNNIIYKTKNMLSIIPTNMLESQNNTELLIYLSN